MAGNIAIFEGNGRINIAIKDEDGNIVYQLQGLGGQVTVDDEDTTVMGYIKGLDPDQYGAITLLSDGSVLNGIKDGKVVEQVVESAEKEEGDKTPDSSWTKVQLKEYMDANSISYNGGDTKQDLIDKITAN